MNSLEKKMLKIGLDILKNNSEFVITNVENYYEDINVQTLIEEGERLLEDENLDDIEIDQEDLKQVMNIVEGIEGVSK